MEILSPAEIRVVGALLEKDLTTPEYYPLTLNSLHAACNQKSNRDPVVNYDEDTVARAIAVAQDKGLIVRVTGAGHRVEKYGHRLGEKLNLGRREVALLCVLMLRGPQTVGELRGRSERMHDFTDLEEVERCLESLATREPDPLVARMPRGRWMQLFGGPADIASASEESSEGIVRTSGDATMDRRVAALELELAQLKRQLAEIQQQFDAFRQQFQ